ncbi:MAG TPA: folate-binding protein [Mycobacteriales bacterium]|nr:folate-binding protein [Mycobacteriales bacterium]
MTSAPTLASPLLELPGAVPAGGPDAGVALHYGDPIREERALARGTGWVDRSNRGVIAVPGADRLSWLHSITSQHLSALADGTGTEGLVLSPHGHVEQHFVVAELAGTTWLDTEPGAVPALLAYLNSMRFLLRVEPRDATAELAVLTVAGPGAAAVLAGADLPAPADVWTVLPIEGGGFARRTRTDEIDLLVPRAVLTTVAEKLTAAGASPVGSWAYEAMRVEARRPRLGFETDHRTIPHEVGWIGTAVHLDKGCYRGQETVARVHNLGRPPRRLVLLHLSGERDELPAPGTPLLLDGRTVGFLGTAAHHHELGPVALAVVKRTVADGTVLDAAGIPAAVDGEIDG